MRDFEIRAPFHLELAPSRRISLSMERVFRISFWVWMKHVSLGYPYTLKMR